MMHVPIQKIKENISNEAFQVFIGVQTIGNWKSDPWWIGVFGNNPELVPYIEKMLLVIDADNEKDLNPNRGYKASKNKLLEIIEVI